MKRRVVATITIALAAILSLGLSNPVWAQSSGSESSSGSDSTLSSPRLRASGGFGFSGELEGEAELEVQGSTRSFDIENEDMLRTNAGAIGVEFPVHKYIILGGRLAANWFRTEGQEDESISRSTALNIDAVPKLRYPFEKSGTELSVSVPVGLTVNIPSKDTSESFQNNSVSGSIETKNGLSWNISLLAGVTQMIGESFGLFLEGGLYHQDILWKIDGEVEGVSVGGDIKGKFNQFRIEAGALVSF